MKATETYQSNLQRRIAWAIGFVLLIVLIVGVLYPILEESTWSFDSFSFKIANPSSKTDSSPLALETSSNTYDHESTEASYFSLSNPLEPEANIRKLFQAIYQGDNATADSCFTQEVKIGAGILYQIEFQDRLLQLPKQYDQWQIAENEITGNTAKIKVKLFSKNNPSLKLIYQFVLYKQADDWKIGELPDSYIE